MGLVWLWAACNYIFNVPILLKMTWSCTVLGSGHECHVYIEATGWSCLCPYIEVWLLIFPSAAGGAIPLWDFRNLTSYGNMVINFYTNICSRYGSNKNTYKGWARFIYKERGNCEKGEDGIKDEVEVKEPQKWIIKPRADVGTKIRLSKGTKINNKISKSKRYFKINSQSTKCKISDTENTSWNLFQK